MKTTYLTLALFAALSIQDNTIADNIVTLKNTEPVFISTPITNAVLSLPYTYNITAINPNGGALAYISPTLPSWLKLSLPKVSTLSKTFTSPIGVTIDTSSNLYVIDNKDNIIYKMTPVGTTTTIVKEGNFISPHDIAVDISGTFIYVADTGNGCIHKINTAGNIVFSAGSCTTLLPTEGDNTKIEESATVQESSAIAFNNPQGITVIDNILYVADSGNNCIRKANATDGTLIKDIGICNSGEGDFHDGPSNEARFNSPVDVAVDNTGNLYVADQGNHCIRKISSDGTVTTLVGNKNSPGFADGNLSNAQFNMPTSIAIDATNTIYITDIGESGITSNFNTPPALIRKVTPQGIVVTIAGRESGSVIDGPGSIARFDLPSGIAVDVSGNVYVSDQNNGVIRKIEHTQVTLEGIPSIQDIGMHTVMLRATSNLDNRTSDQPFIISVTTLPEPPPFSGYSSYPAPNSILDFGNSVIGTPITLELYSRENGNLPLVMKSASISGDAAGDFRIITPTFPLTMNDGEAAVTVTIQCLPSDIGPRTATLKLNTNAFDLPDPTYTLTCNGQLPAGYSSDPPPGSMLLIGKKRASASISYGFTINENGGSPLKVNLVSITGPHAEDFKVITPLFPFTIADGGSPEAIRVRCQHFDKDALHTAVLKLSSNDPKQSLITYNLECHGVGALYSSTLTPNSTLDFGSTPVDTMVTKHFDIAEEGDDALIIKSITLKSDHANDFKIMSPDFPIMIHDGAKPVTIAVTCKPAEIGLHTAMLTMESNDPEHPLVTYTLTCRGYLSDKAGFSSVPASHSVVNLGNTPIGTSVKQSLNIAETGRLNLNVKLARIIGPQAADFKISPTTMTITEGSAAQTITIYCTPSDKGVREATLELSSNDALNPKPSYQLTCTGEVHQPGYDSIPKPGSLLEVGSSELGQPTTVNLTVVEVGEEDLEVSAITINGDDADDFSLVKGSDSFTLRDGDSPHILTVQCIPHQLQERQARLHIMTNDPDLPMVNYDLRCTGLPITLPVFSGDIHAQTGAIGNNLSIDMSEVVTLMGHIHPESRHVGQLATITMVYHWQPIGAERVLTASVVIAEEKVLGRSLDLMLFRGRLTNLPGTFQVDLRYQVGKEFLSGHIATLTVQPNRPPTAIQLSADHVAEYSATDTVVGLFQGIDPDKDEKLTYDLINDANGRFKVIDNKLCVANGALLSVVQEAKPVIVVRAVDVAGGYVDKQFVITIIPVVQSMGIITPDAIRLTQWRIAENSPNGSVVGKLFVDGYPDNTYEYTLVDDAEGRFIIDRDIVLVAEGDKLDFESKRQHVITVSVHDSVSNETVEKSFDITLTNVVDVHLSDYALRDDMNRLISSAVVDATKTVSLHVTLFPDVEHIGQVVDLVGVALYEHEGGTTVMMLDGRSWRQWDGDFSTLRAIRSMTLQESNELTVWKGKLKPFAGGHFQLFVGYRLHSGSIMYALPAFEVQVR